MPKTDIATIKTWFETGDKPTQEQFWNWLDSFLHLDGNLPMAQVTGLGSALSGLASQASVNALKSITINASGATASQALPVGVILHKIRIKGTSDQTFNVGTSAGGTQILNGETLSAGQAGIYTVDFDAENATTIFFSGMSGNNNIKLYLQI